ncbi:MAG: sugar ABC transporter permease [Spirochaetales bacterium]|uniref:carbohydrate ABC transporter permease n=1 Tax=Bullifex sp. TaxID=2815808 RepID=UPI002A58A7C4|nr:sugar ABC transporter permease [Bullifex sp.]MDD7270693.1 sugar ABC transporter permease [Spirochaetales bacterium]MDY4066319.1 sugar ABC transporter permease [Bullifex sp.]
MKNIDLNRKAKNSKLKIAWLFVLPVLLIRGFTTVYPMIVTLYDSFFEIKLLKGPGAKFIGLGNFITIFKDPKLILSIKFTLIFTVCSVSFLIILGTLLSLLLNVKMAGKRFLRTIVLIPWAIPMVVVGRAARWAFNDNFGFINDLIRMINPSFHVDWLSASTTARFSVIAVDLWKNIPYFAILCLAALQFLSDDIYEAAIIDGVNRVQSFFYITLPNIMTTILNLAIFFTIWRMTSYDIVYAMTSGGPADSTSLLAYRIMTESFTNLNVGYASAIAIVLFLFMAVISRGGMRLIKKLEK